MNRDRRKVIANILADAAKYALTVGVISSTITGKITIFSGLSLGFAVLSLEVLAYFVTPKDKKEEYIWKGSML